MQNQTFRNHGNPGPVTRTSMDWQSNNPRITGPIDTQPNGLNSRLSTFFKDVPVSAEKLADDVIRVVKSVFESCVYQFKMKLDYEKAEQMQYPGKEKTKARSSRDQKVLRMKPGVLEQLLSQVVTLFAVDKKNLHDKILSLTDRNELLKEENKKLFDENFELKFGNELLENENMHLHSKIQALTDSNQQLVTKNEELQRQLDYLLSRRPTSGSGPGPGPGPGDSSTGDSSQKDDGQDDDDNAGSGGSGHNFPSSTGGLSSYANSSSNGKSPSETMSYPREPTSTVGDHSVSSSDEVSSTDESSSTESDTDEEDLDELVIIPNPSDEDAIKRREVDELSLSEYKIPDSESMGKEESGQKFVRNSAIPSTMKSCTRDDTEAFPHALTEHSFFDLNRKEPGGSGKQNQYSTPKVKLLKLKLKFQATPRIMYAAAPDMDMPKLDLPGSLSVSMHRPMAPSLSGLVQAKLWKS